MITTIEERIREHMPEPTDTLNCYKCFLHENWEDRDPKTGELKGFITYFFLDFPFDMIVTAAKDNRFSKSHWKILRDTIINRVKTIRIQSDPTNKVLQRAVKKYGGYFDEEGEIIFRKPKLNKEK